MKKILVVGSVALDSVKTPFGEVNRALGGSATYFSASARFFSPVGVVAVVGRDFPKAHLRLLERLGVDVSGIEIANGKTFFWQGRYDYDLNSAQTLRTELNVFETFRPKISPRLRSVSTVFLANIDPELQLGVLSQVKKPDLVACDTMNFWIKNKPRQLGRVLKRVNIFLCNDSEARQFSGEFNLKSAARSILKMGPQILVIKKGEHGVLCFSKNFLFTAPAFLLEQVYDPTGAGDTFAGGFIGYLSRQGRVTETGLRKAIIYGSVLASYNVESFSLKRLASLKRSEIESRYKEFREITKF